MINFKLIEGESLLVLTPYGPLEKSDFEHIGRAVDVYIKEQGKLKGILIYTKDFPGWKDFAALVSHLFFVKDHHHHVEKVAAVTDASFLSILPTIADHFVEAKVKHFDYDKKDEALNWLCGI